MAESKKSAPKKTTRRPNQKKWIRNIREQVPAYLTLSDGKHFELRPRGQRGDTAPVTKAEMEDIAFQRNIGLLFEIITDAEAKQGLAKQMTNQQQRHPSLDRLRNEYDQPYEKGVVMDVPHEEQGTVVAGVTTDGKNVNVTRAVVPGTKEFATQNPDIEEQPGGQEEVTLTADEVARKSKELGLEGPAAGLGGEIRVTAEEVRKT